jgi:Spy/CpxP family protein refolding chaperone
MNTRTGFVLAAALVLTAGLVLAQAGEGRKAGKCPEGAGKQGQMADCPRAEAMPGPGPGAGGPEDMEGPGEGGMWRMMLRDPGVRTELKLTKEQGQKVDDLLDGQEKVLVQKRAEIQTARIDYRAELKKDAVDMKKVRELADKIAVSTADMVRTTMVTAAEISSVLTPEQKTKLEEKRAEHRQMMMQHFRKTRR